MVNESVAPSLDEMKHYRNSKEMFSDGINVGDKVWAYNASSGLVKGVVARYSAAHPDTLPVVCREDSIEKTVATYRDQHSGDQEIPYHGSFFNKIVKIKTQADEVDDLIRKALAAAKELGYCNETKNVIKKMGLELPSDEQTVSVSLVFDVPVGVDKTADELVASLTSSLEGVRVRKASE